MILPHAGARRWAVALPVLLQVLAGMTGCEESPHQITDGRRLYRDGRLASGQPLTAVVEYDVPVEGTQFTCVNCHLRSGMGTAEGAIVVPPVTGPTLYGTVERPPHARPAYTDATLARAIRDGIDAAGRPLDPLMPRYHLPDRDVASLVAYLRTLATKEDPGVTETSIRFAAVFTDDADAAARDAMFAVLDTYFEERNTETRLETRRAERARLLVNKPYRKWLLARWALHGPPDTWAAQLEHYYRDEPPFALLSGMSASEWRPIHEFCERREVPCLLPNTDLPVIAERDFYSLYFSKGLTLEAQALADHLSRQRSPVRVLQVFHEDGGGALAARALRAALEGHPQVTVFDLAVAALTHPAREVLTAKLGETRATAVLLWLPADELGALHQAGWPPEGTTILLSSTLLGGDLAAVPLAMRPGTVVAHPFLLPDDLERGLRRADVWLTSRHIKTAQTRVQAQTYFACLVAGEGLMHLPSYLRRDYLLDAIDHLPSASVLPSCHPNVSFGPGQRYLAKGAYRLTLGGDGERPTVEAASWIALGP